MSGYNQKYTIYGTDGSVRCTVKKLEYSGVYLGERSVSLTVEWPRRVDWQVGDYLEYRGDRYTLDYIPGITRQYRSGSRGDAVVYDSIRMKCDMRELEHCQMIDVVRHDNQIAYTAMGEFSFYIGKAVDFARRVEACLTEAYGEGRWTVVCDDGLAVRKDKAMSISRDTSVMSAMAQFSNDFGVNFTVEGRTITFGTTQEATAHSFVYGKGNGLKKLTIGAEDNEKIVTKGKFYGSDKNLPYRYYVTIDRSLRVSSVLTVRRGGSYSNVELLTGEKWNALWWTMRHGTHEVYDVRVRCGSVEVNAEVNGYEKSEDKAVEGVKPKYLRVFVSDGLGNTPEQVRAFGDAAERGEELFFIRGVSYDDVPGTMIYVPAGAPDNYSIHNLMLPGFPTESLASWVSKHAAGDAEPGTLGRILSDALAAGYGFSEDQFRPWISAPTLGEYGLRDGEKVFVQDDEEHGWWEIHPSLEEMTLQGLEGTRGYVAGAKTAEADGRLDKILTGTSVKDNGTSRSGDFGSGKTDVNGVMIAQTVTVSIPNLGFNPWNYRKNGETPTLSMKSGMCGGRDFEIVNCQPMKDARDGYELTLNRTLDTSLERNFPYDPYQISKGDKYVLVGIEMPDAYVEASAARLLVQSLDWLSKNCVQKRTYQPEIDNIFMANHPELKLREGMKMLIVDEELMGEVAVTIAQLTIKENQDDLSVNIPQYEVRLDDEQEASLMQQVEATVKGVVSRVDFSSGFAGLERQLKAFLKRDVDEETNATLSIGKDLSVDGRATMGDAEVKGDAEVGGKVRVGGGVEAESVVVRGDEGIMTEGYKPVPGGGVHIWKDGNMGGHIVTDTLEVKKKATFTELEIKKKISSGGDVIYSCASNVLFDAAPIAEDDGTAALMVGGVPVTIGGDALTSVGMGEVRAYRCWFLASDGEKRITNDWRVGDQAICQTANLTTGTQQANKYFFRLVQGVSNEPEEHKGKLCHWFDLAVKKNVALSYEGRDFAECNGWDGESTPDNPEAGDSVVQLGSQTDKSRQYAYAVNVTDANRIDYAGIGSISGKEYDLAQYVRHFMSPEKIVLQAESVEYFSGTYNGENSKPNVTFMGAWTEGTKAYYYQEYSYDNKLWICVNRKGTTATPSKNSADWQYVIGGTDGLSDEQKQEIVDELKGKITMPDIHIVDGEWWVDDYNTHVKAEANDGHTPTVEIKDGEWWINGVNTHVKAQGEQGIGRYTSLVFKRSALASDTIAQPTGGTWDKPLPTGWSDGIPTLDSEKKNTVIWMSKAVIDSRMDGKAGSPTPKWSTPRVMVDTADFDVAYLNSATENPGKPTEHHKEDQGTTIEGGMHWTNTADPDLTVWMATSHKTGGEWSEWEVSRIKGETAKVDHVDFYFCLGNQTQGDTCPKTKGKDAADFKAKGWSEKALTPSASNPYLWVCEVTTYDYGGVVVGIPYVKTIYSEGTPGQGVLTSFVFKRQDSEPSAPADNSASYNSPVPSGWSDSVPEGTAMVWMTKATFTTDSKAPQKKSGQWSKPVMMKDDTDFDVEFNSSTGKTAPTIPEHHPLTDADRTDYGWSNEGTGAVWMATSVKRNGKWEAWRVSRIKGEDGNPGEGKFKSVVFRWFAKDEKVSTPLGGTWSNPLPNDTKWSDGIPAAVTDGTLYSSYREFTDKVKDYNETAWSKPMKMVDTPDMDIQYSPGADRPTTNPDSSVHHVANNNGWVDTPTTDTAWMAVDRRENGKWTGWKISKIKGEQGDPGGVGKAGQQIYKSSVFKRYAPTSTQPTPTAPTGGSISLVPEGWSDGIPTGSDPVWMSTRIFTDDGESPQQDKWTTPRLVADTSDVDFAFYDGEDYGGKLPTTHHSSPDQGNGWKAASSTNTIWMAVDKMVDGQWTGWSISRIKGEAGKATTIKSITPHYLITTLKSGVTIDGFTWQDNIVNPTEEKPYMWCYETTTYTDKDVPATYTDPYIKANYAKGGEAGKDAISVELIPAVAVFKTDDNGIVDPNHIQQVAVTIQRGLGTLAISECVINDAVGCNAEYDKGIVTLKNVATQKFTYTISGKSVTDEISVGSGLVNMTIGFIVDNVVLYRTIEIPFTVDITKYTQGEVRNRKEWSSEYASWKTGVDGDMGTAKLDISNLKQKSTEISLSVASISSSLNDKVTKEDLQNRIKASEDALDGKINEQNGKIDGQGTRIGGLENSRDEIIASVGQIKVTNERVSESVYALTKGSLNLLWGTELEEMPTNSGNESTDWQLTQDGHDRNSAVVLSSKGHHEDTWSCLTYSKEDARPGRTYTFSVWLKSDEGLLSTAYLDMQCDKNGQHVNVGNNIAINQEDLPKGEWKQFSCELSIPYGTDMDTLMLYVTLARDGQLYISQPILKEDGIIVLRDEIDTMPSTTGSESTSWEQPEDVCDGSRSILVTSVGHRSNVYHFASFVSDEVSAGKSYTFSVWLMTDEDLQPAAYMEMQCEKDGKRVGVGISKIIANADLPTDQWKRFDCTLEIPSTTSIDKLVCYVGIQRNGHVYISQPQLEEGTKATAWAPRSIGEAELRRTGIDVRDKRIDMQADNFTLRNNSGEETLGVDSNGNTMFKGVVNAQGLVIPTLMGGKGIEMYMDDKGMPHLLFYDTDGETQLYDLGYTGLRQMISNTREAYWDSMYGLSIAEPESSGIFKSVDIYLPDVASARTYVYQYHSAWTRQNGNIYIADSEHDGVWYTSKALNEENRRTSGCLVVADAKQAKSYDLYHFTPNGAQYICSLLIDVINNSWHVGRYDKTNPTYITSLDVSGDYVNVRLMRDMRLNQ